MTRRSEHKNRSRRVRGEHNNVVFGGEVLATTNVQRASKKQRTSPVNNDADAIQEHDDSSDESDLAKINVAIIEPSMAGVTEGSANVGDHPMEHAVDGVEVHDDS